MKSINLIFGIHNHKPIGCSHEEFEATYQNVYKPFLSILNEYPEIPVTLYFSGIILEWLEKNHPEYFVLLREMLKNKQLELIGGGYFDPILSMIPSSDKLGQIELLTTYIRANFGNRPRGIWLTEQEWEPALAQIMNNCGMEYLFLDNIIFKAAGLNNDGLYYSYITEEQGKMIKVFPISRGLNRCFQKYQPKDALKFIKRKTDDSGERIICYFEDGENWFHDNHKRDRD
jgi:alpha-amylase/alpha-mannosidase (GH57 family)